MGNKQDCILQCRGCVKINNSNNSIKRDRNLNLPLSPEVLPV